MSKEISDEELVRLISEYDEKLRKTDLLPHQRESRVAIEINKRLGRGFSIVPNQGIDTISKRVFRVYKEMYGIKNFSGSSLHVGLYVDHDIFALVKIPHVYGTPELEFSNLAELTEFQKSRIHNDKEISYIFHDCVQDVIITAAVAFSFDRILTHGDTDGLLKTSRLAVVKDDPKIWLRQAAFNLQGAVGILNNSFQNRSAVHASILAAEMGLKSILSNIGVTRKEIKFNFGHCIDQMVKYISNQSSDFDIEKVKKLNKKIPLLVKTRYQSDEISRRDAGEIFCASQSVVGVCARYLGGFEDII